MSAPSNTAVGTRAGDGAGAPDRALRRVGRPHSVGLDRTALALLGMCIVATALRFATLASQSFDYDESFTVGILNGSLGHVLHRIPITESTPPLYYVLAWLWTRVFGLSPLGVRSLSAILGVALVPVAYAVARRMGSRRAGLIAATLVAVSPFLVWYSEEARTYSLLALLSLLSFWSFLTALERPTGRHLAVWALASAAAVLSHYFAGFLIVPEAAWLLITQRRRTTLAAVASVAAVSAALIPLVLAQADNRTQWIEALSLPSRIVEVIKKWVTGEIAPTHNWVPEAVGAVVLAALLYCALGAGARAGRRAAPAFGVGGAALLLPLLLDLAGLHYLISKNVMPALAVLVTGSAVVLGAGPAGRRRDIGVAGTAIAAAFFLAVTIDDLVDPALQRPDYRAAARALGPPGRRQVVVTPNLGDAPMGLYRPGAAALPGAGWPTRQVVVVDPLPRADLFTHRPATPAPPPGFAFAGRRDTPTYTLICYSAPAPVRLSAGPVLALLGGAAGSSAQVWPDATTTSATLPCR